MVKALQTHQQRIPVRRVDAIFSPLRTRLGCGYYAERRNSWPSCGVFGKQADVTAIFISYRPAMFCARSLLIPWSKQQGLDICIRTENTFPPQGDQSLPNHTFDTEILICSP